MQAPELPVFAERREEQRLERVGALDGLRGVAILLVLLFHFGERTAFEPFTQFGWTGVDLFFVLSGFLITGILLRTRQSPRYFRTFYARRTLRIFPLYYGALFFLLIVLKGLFPELDRIDHRWQYWLYLSNFGVVLFGWSPEVLGHFWSLAVEEHFYLLWPLVVRRFARWLFPLVAVSVLAILSLRVFLAWQRVPWGANHYLSFCRVDTLLIGGLIAVLSREPTRRKNLTTWGRRALVISALALGLLIIYEHGSLPFQHWPVRTFGYTLLASFYGAVVVFAGAPGRFSALMDISLLRFFGKYSYGLYVLHLPVMKLLDSRLTRMESRALVPQIGRIAVLGGVTVVAAYVSWHLFEKWFLNFKPAYPEYPLVEGARDPSS